MIAQLINIAHKNNCKVGICGQAPSDFPSFAAFLVENEIDSMSLNPDTLVQTKALIYVMEQAIERHISYKKIGKNFIRNTLSDYGEGLVQEVIRMMEQEATT
jgi:phosphoenolpyruvate-protein kinase (PTS system EI component)